MSGRGKLLVSLCSKTNKVCESVEGCGDDVMTTSDSGCDEHVVSCSNNVGLTKNDFLNQSTGGSFNNAAPVAEVDSFESINSQTQCFVLNLDGSLSPLTAAVVDSNITEDNLDVSINNKDDLIIDNLMIGQDAINIIGLEEEDHTRPEEVVGLPSFESFELNDIELQEDVVLQDGGVVYDNRLEPMLRNNLTDDVGQENISPTLANEPNENDFIFIPNPMDENEHLKTVTTLTKSGNVRKRKKYIYDHNERKKIKKAIVKQKHAVVEGCNPTCKLKCREKITEERRIEINSQYWVLEPQEQKSFVFGCVEKLSKRRETVLVESRRSCTNKYSMKSQDGHSVQVCKTFFLTTLGYTKTNDKILQNMSKVTSTNITPPTDRRKGKIPSNKVDHSVIKDHIQSFDPTISHYRREHAPFRKYLPSDLSIQKMFEDFKQKNPQFKCSYDLYRTEVSNMNISFVKLGHEECELCEHFNLHPHQKNDLKDDCQDCISYKKHSEQYENARKEYKKDAEKELGSDEIIYSVDLQKVIMLPRCDMFKTVIFTQRLSVYNESFVPVGTNKKCQTVACIWHEGISGRLKEDIISTIYKFLTTEGRDMKKITLWMDNCTSQNKNWTLFSFLVYMVNSTLILADTVTIKYFEPGHTFMSADSFHHRVEKSLHSIKKVYDFNDFKDAVQSSAAKVTALEMGVNDFIDWKDLSYTRKKHDTRPYIKDITEVEAKRGERCLQYAVTIGGEKKILDFLCKKYKENDIDRPSVHSKPRGFPRTKKLNLIKSLVFGKDSIIPENRQQFWKDLPEREDCPTDADETPRRKSKKK